MRPLVLADNQDITKAGILFVTDKISGFDPIVEVENRQMLVQALTTYPSAVVLLDYTLFDLAGIEDLLILQERFKRVGWILFSEDLSDDFMRRTLFSSNAFSIVMKEATLDEISETLQKSLLDIRYICQRVRNLLQNKIVIHDLEDYPVLTTTEREILKSIASGKTTKEIASERFSSIHTIATHRKNIFRKINVNNVHEATKYALRAGIIDSAEYYI